MTMPPKAKRDARSEEIISQQHLAHSPRYGSMSGYVYEVVLGLGGDTKPVGVKRIFEYLPAVLPSHVKRPTYKGVRRLVVHNLTSNHGYFKRDANTDTVMINDYEKWRERMEHHQSYNRNYRSSGRDTRHTSKKSASAVKPTSNGGRAIIDAGDITKAQMTVKVNAPQVVSMMNASDTGITFLGVDYKVVKFNNAVGVNVFEVTLETK